MDEIKLNEFNEIDTIKLSKETTEELESTGYAMVNDNTLSGQYFVIKIEDGYYITKAVGFKLLQESN